jgi:hypothetical protein
MATNFQEMVPIAQNPGAREIFDTIDTTATGGNDVYYVSPIAEPGIGITVTATSTAVVKVQVTTDTIARIQAGTALWADLPAPLASVTSAAVAGGGVLYAVSAVRLNVTTALAGLNASIALRTNSTRW